MTYSCCDFTDDVLNSLKVEVPIAFADSPSDQADLAITEIERLQSATNGLTFDDQENAIIIASLRMIQRIGVQTIEEKIASSGGEFDPLGDDDIDKLIERINLPVAPLPAIDWRAVARDLAGALSSCTDQIGQMRGMFDDVDGEIQEAVTEADAAQTRYQDAVNANSVARLPDNAAASLRLTAVVAGGRLVEIVSDDPALRGIAYTVVDYDCEGSDRVGAIVRKDGTTEAAIIAFSEIDESDFRAVTPACD